MTEEKTLENEMNPAPPDQQESTPKSQQVLLLKLELLKKIDLFKHLSEQNLQQVVEKSPDIILKKNELLFEEGALERKMYVILAGEILIHKKIKNIAVLKQGEYFGEIILIDHLPRSASATAYNDSFLMVIDENLFQKYITTSSKALFEMMRVFNQRLRNDMMTMTKDTQKLCNFTHDMGNCLISLEGSQRMLKDLASLFQGTQKKHRSRHGSDKIKKSISTLLSVRNNLVTMIDLSLARVKKTRTKYVKTEFSIIPLIEETIAEISCHKYVKGKAVEVKVEGTPKKVCFNYLDIKRVLQNLIINAGYISKKDGKIHVHVKNLKSAVEVRVQDYGAGIPEKIQPLILKETYTTKSDGNGFGLMSCREIIVDHHQGMIDFETEIGKGTTFYFTLPYEI